MACRRCPHHVRHGFANDKGKIEFIDLCGLKVKKLEREEAEKLAAKKAPAVPEKKPIFIKPNPKRYTQEQACTKVPFSPDFEYMRCDVYYATFKTNQHKNDVVPTQDFQFSEIFSSVSITDMDLL